MTAGIGAIGLAADPGPIRGMPMAMGIAGVAMSIRAGMIRPVLPLVQAKAQRGVRSTIVTELVIQAVMTGVHVFDVMKSAVSGAVAMDMAVTRDVPWERARDMATKARVRAQLTGWMSAAHLIASEKRIVALMSGIAVMSVAAGVLSV